MSIREAKLHIREHNLNQEDSDQLKNLLDGGQIIPIAVLTADREELLDIIRRHPRSQQSIEGW